MSSLQDFLLENLDENATEQVVLSARLKDSPFTIRPMSSKEFNAYSMAATTFKKGKKVNFNSEVFSNQVIINHTIEPNFKDAEFVKKAGCITPEQLLNKVLRAGEMSELAQRISAFSGFESEMDDLVDEAKNS